MSNTQKKNVPELRFPGFEGEWEEKKLGEIFQIISGSTPLKSNKKFYENGNINWVKTTDLNNSKVTHSKEKITEYAMNSLKLKLVPKNSVLIAMYGGFNQIGRTGLLKIDATINQAISALLMNHETNPEFIQAYLNYQVKGWKRYAASSRKDPNITKKDIEQFKVPYVSINEQQKIGEFFSKLDRQIELEEQKLELLQQQKKGYMQKIFSQELRFKDENGEDYPEWEEKQLGELGVTYAGLSGKAKEDFGFGKDVYVSYVNVFKNNIATLEMVENVSIKPGEKQNNVKFGDILFTTSSEVPHEVGMSSVWLYEKDNVYLNSFCFGFRTTVSFINPIFLARYLRSFEMRKLITILAQGSTRFNISKKELMKLIVKIPRLDEQNRIINLFSILDGGIELQSMKVRKLKKRKQGLLQKMFI
ncbi:TPA: restriction endonuclease subunit S [Staphylococcus aureus]|uniref:restriction endonuclease subunit S n=2 Tax=Staphylococcus aureus TaxID=1280 RepID=UPI0001FAD64D|nr:restriction endonuclease subunit S [Staphylococcus aureus]ATV03242.1 Putative restriction and modification system specificity protein [Staphylococcus aureus O11]AVS04097.1 restriction endonuclease subunit S [Staphylococcus aureus]EGQ0540486.1 restriction endonuclease subunit S [Staphylococcus aureus]KIT80121.1 restriction endonuclease subunit S [Staphylococcus aureus]MBH4713025.1 restriction endonuclease subunit S [Staphylococcus aureus]